MDNLAGRLALVTGGSRGIGKGIATALGRAGATIVVTYNSNKALAVELVEALTDDGITAHCFRLCAEDRGSVREVIAEINKSIGWVDILVNNAAISQEKPFDTITDSDWDNMMAVNLRGPFACTQEVLPAYYKYNLDWRAVGRL